MPPQAGIHPLGSARRPGSCRSSNAGAVSPACPPSRSDADCGSFVTLRPCARPGFHRASSLLWPLLSPGALSPARSPRVRTCTFDPCRQALPDTSFGDGGISRSLARSSPVPSLTACSCSCGRVLATPFFQLGLAASTLGFATLLVTFRGYLLSGNKYMLMSGTRGWAPGLCPPDLGLTLHPLPPPNLLGLGSFFGPLTFSVGKGSASAGSSRDQGVPLGLKGEAGTPCARISAPPISPCSPRLALYATHFHPNILGVTGTPDQVAKTAQRYGIVFRRVDQGDSSLDYRVDHSADT